ncbi:MAG: hypothetical protein P8M80_03935 [Pirellulaceae bacterium]|nr:hypothetical protein [Pirellulaceae bacterium]
MAAIKTMVTFSGEYHDFQTLLAGKKLRTLWRAFPDDFTSANPGKIPNQAQLINCSIPVPKVQEFFPRKMRSRG